MKVCKKCGTEYPDSMNFCLECGKKLEPVTEAAPSFIEAPDLSEIKNTMTVLKEEIRKTREDMERIKSTKGIEEEFRKKVTELVNSDELRKAVLDRLPKEFSKSIQNQMAEVDWLKKNMQGVVNEINKNRAQMDEIRRGLGGGLPRIAQDLKVIKQKIIWLETRGAQGAAPVPANMQMLFAKVQKMEREIFMLKSAIPMVIE